MTYLERLHADQHDDVLFASDHALAAFLAETPLAVAARDLEPHTAIESLHLIRFRSAA